MRADQGVPHHILLCVLFGLLADELFIAAVDSLPIIVNFFFDRQESPVRWPCVRFSDRLTARLHGWDVVQRGDEARAAHEATDSLLFDPDWLSPMATREVDQVTFRLQGANF